MKKPLQRNLYTVINGRVHGQFHPEFRAETERRAKSEGLTFDEYVTRDLRQSLNAVMAMCR